MEESAPQIVTSNLENRKLRPERLNLDKIGAVRTCFTSILIVAFFPCLIRLGAMLIELMYPLRPGGMFLIFFAGAFAYAWQLASSASVVVKYLRGERGNPTQHVAFGFNALPKVLLSHSILILLLFFLFPTAGDGGDFPTFVRSILLVVVSVGFFLSWAPAFVAAEFFTKPLVPVDDDLDDFESIKLTFSKPKFFSGMGIFDLGIERSFYFCVNNFVLTLSLLLLGCCARVIPAALGIILFEHSSSYGAAITESVLSSIGIGMLMVALGMTFLGSLPKEARAELELLDDSVISLPLGSVRKDRFLNKFLTSLLVIASVLATYFLIQTLKEEQSFPDKLIPQTFDLQRTPNSLTIKFEIDDKSAAYRWLDAERFRLQVPRTKEEIADMQEGTDAPQSDLIKKPLERKKGGVLEALQNKIESEQDAPVESAAKAPVPAVESKFNLIPPKEALFYSESGELLDEKFFKPYYGKIKVSLTFDYSSNSEKNFNLESSINPKLSEQQLVYLLIDQTVQTLGAFSVAPPSEQ